MFPETESLITVNESTATVNLGKSFKFDFGAGDFIVENGRLIETNDISAWIEKILHTEKGRFLIYDDTTYGVHLEDLIIGTNYPVPFVDSELKREIENAVIQHPLITGISNFAITRLTSGIEVSLEVNLIDETRNITTTFE